MAASVTIALANCDRIGYTSGMVNDHPLKIFRNKQEPRLSQGRLADQLGVWRTTVARWETGKQKVDRKLLPKVTEATGISPAELRPDLADLFKESAE
jgi:transcriptional regulator with XRE-family HTH domain